jgi:hypothetical protein
MSTNPFFSNDSTIPFVSSVPSALRDRRDKQDGTGHQMKSKMNCIEANLISIVSFLHQQGVEPVRIRGREVWYLSPLRTERTASFKVDTVKNRWFDHGIGQGGKLVDLGIRMRAVSVQEFLTFLRGLKLESGQRILGAASNVAPRVIKLLSISHPSLQKFLSIREISFGIANTFCREIHYSVASRDYFAIAFQNDYNGFEVRNRFFKGCIGPKGPTTLLKDASSFSLFEGFVDFLSSIEIGVLDQEQSAIILNSVNQLPSALRILDRYRPGSVRAFFDNDQAGRQCFESMQAFYPRVVDSSQIYRKFNDLNEMLMKTKTK